MQVLTILASSIFLLACLIPFLSPRDFWWIGFVGLAVPYLIGLLVLLFLFWLLTKPSWALLPLLILLLGLQQIKAVFGYHLKHSFKEISSEKTIRIVNWNIRSFNGITNNQTGKKIIKAEILDLILKQSPDIICLQEFDHSYGKKRIKNTQVDNIGLFTISHPYYYFSKDYTSSNGYASGSIIFSRFPIVDSGKLKYPKGESIIFSDIVKGKDTIRIYTTHLQSFKFKKNDYDNIDKVTENDEEVLLASKNIFNKMKPSFKRRAAQAMLVKEWMSKSKFPSIITGDFNDVPNSYTYFTIKGDKLQDAFLSKSFGIGKSYLALAPTLRIDYVLADKQFEIEQFEMIDEALSDHSMLVTDVKLKKDKH